ncbi:Fic family protein [Sansalvadorimonas sp. 2012CJ34-2]|uniref:Fic family protein n=1 Tax=Parendozoicomonas callyspongiae TaxID=2942213 RepID=A0ABT0PB40_9GAMM|nr:Fic family protein [Sansalvadorimonas sp. 2012CJ34-2]MCL6268493.1 Fic family protein [Sansalvadorimonas sp. 2012CJ34-2]
MDINRKRTGSQRSVSISEEVSEDSVTKKTCFSGRETSPSVQEKKIKDQPCCDSGTHTVERKKISEPEVDKTSIEKFCEQFFEVVVDDRLHKLDTSLFNQYPVEIIVNSCQKFQKKLEEIVSRELSNIQKHIDGISNIGPVSGNFPCWHTKSCSNISFSKRPVDSLKAKMKLISKFSEMINIMFLNLGTIKVAEMELVQLANSNKAFDGFDMTQIWRLFIDGDDHEKRGKYGYENEPGYLSGCYRGMAMALRIVENKGRINSSVLTVIHDEVVKGVFYVPYSQLRFEEIEPRMREKKYEKPYSLYCKHVNKNLSTDGLQELIFESVKIGEDGNKHKYKHKKYQYVFTHKPCMSHRDGEIEIEYSEVVCDYGIKLMIDDLLNNCYEVVENKYEPEEIKERAIAHCIAHLERIHPYHDGNCRLFGFILANALRIHAGLKPVIWKDPNILDGYSIEEIVREQQEGCRKFLSYCSFA